MRTLLTLTTIAIAFQFLFADPAKELTIDKARIKAVPPASPNTGGFMEITNTTNKNLFLTKADSNISNSVELHTMTMIDGVMKMRPIDKIEINAKSKLELKPGSFHIMFIGLKSPLKRDEKIEVTLTFSNGQKEKLLMPVVEIEMK